MARLFGRQIHLLTTSSSHSGVPSARAIFSSANSIIGKCLNCRVRAHKQDGISRSDRNLLTSANLMNMGTDAVAEHAAPVLPSFMQKTSDDGVKTYNPPELDNVSEERPICIFNALLRRTLPDFCDAIVERYPLSIQSVLRTAYSIALAQVLFVEAGWGADQHGQDVTVRARLSQLQV